MTSPASALLSRILTELEVRSRTDDLPAPASRVPLPSRLATGDLAWASVGAATLAAHREAAFLDSDRIATAYRSDRFLTLDGAAPSVWSPFSGFWRTADGWIRTHGNYPHHAARLRAGLRLDGSADADAVMHALSAISASDAVTAITASGGLAVRVSPERADVDAALRRTPLLDIGRLGDAPHSPAPSITIATAPLTGIRVLDLTRVIAGPVCTRTLALLGAEVLRIDPPQLTEPEWQHLDTGHGKRSARLHAHSPEFGALLAEADVVVLGYRPASLARLGLSPEALIERHPGLIVAQLSAWGIDQPERAGFDSLVQAESGIALIESPDGERPGSLPAQALDHSAGYLLAAAISTLVERRRSEGGSWLVRTSLRRIAAELLGMPRRAESAIMPELDPSPHLQRFDVHGVALVTATPVLPGLEFAAPHPSGSDQPGW